MILTHLELVGSADGRLVATQHVAGRSLKAAEGCETKKPLRIRGSTVLPVTYSGDAGRPSMSRGLNRARNLDLSHRTFFRGGCRFNSRVPGVRKLLRRLRLRGH